MQGIGQIVCLIPELAAKTCLELIDARELRIERRPVRMVATEIVGPKALFPKHQHVMKRQQAVCAADLLPLFMFDFAKERGGADQANAPDGCVCNIQMGADDNAVE